MKPAILSYPIQAHYVVAVSDRVDKNVSRCTLEMISAFELVNRICDKKRITISCRLMPECQCYPSMDILTVATEEYLSSALDNNLDIAELGLFLAVVKDRQQLTTLALGECVTPSSTIQQGNLGHNLGDPVKRDHSVKVL